MNQIYFRSFILLIVIYFLTTGVNAAQSSPNALTLIISNEAPGYAISNMIAQGYGDSSLVAVVKALQPASGSVIPKAFPDTLLLRPKTSEVFTAKLKDFTGLNNPVGINSDGTILISGIFGKDYISKTGYITSGFSSSTLKRLAITGANGSQYYIDSGVEGPGKKNYQVFAVVWSRASSLTISNEGGLIDRMIALGHGGKNMFQVTQLLQPASGGAIPADFVS
jgi:hypothetical protein